MFSKQELSPHAVELFRRVKLSLPVEIGGRLRSNRTFVTHGSYRTLFLFDVWDCNQTDILNRQHFKYCLGHDGRPGAKRDGYFHLWLNKIRIYRERESILGTLEREIPAHVPAGFRYRQTIASSMSAWDLIIRAIFRSFQIFFCLTTWL